MSSAPTIRPPRRRVLIVALVVLTTATACAKVEFERTPYFQPGTEGRPSTDVARLDFQPDVFVAEVDGEPLRGRVARNTYPAYYVFAPGQYRLGLQHYTRTAPEQVITFTAEGGQRYQLESRDDAGAWRAWIIDASTGRTISRSAPVGR